MGFSETLVNRIREALVEMPDVEEREMFQGLTFMVNGKMCIGVRGEEMMCRIDPGMDESVRERPGCRQMIHGNRRIKGYFFIDAEGYKRKTDFDFWIQHALDNNKRAKASRRKE